MTAPNDMRISLPKPGVWEGVLRAGILAPGENKPGWQGADTWVLLATGALPTHDGKGWIRINVECWNVDVWEVASDHVNTTIELAATIDWEGNIVFNAGEHAAIETTIDTADEILTVVRAAALLARPLFNGIDYEAPVIDVPFVLWPLPETSIPWQNWNYLPRVTGDRTP